MEKYKTEFKIKVPHGEIKEALSSLDVMYNVRVDDISLDEITLTLTPKITEQEKQSAVEEKEAAWEKSYDEFRAEYLKNTLKDLLEDDVDLSGDVFSTMDTLFKTAQNQLNVVSFLVKQEGYSLKEITDMTMELIKEMS